MVKNAVPKGPRFSMLRGGILFYMQRIESVLQYILSIEAYVDVVHEVPYTYKLEGVLGSITVVGVNHVHEREHPAFVLLDSVFANVPLDVVCVEGMDNDFKEVLGRELLPQCTLEQAAVRGGEALYAVVQAKKYGLLWQPVEPSDDILFTYLFTLGFSKLQIVTWYILRLLPQYIAQNETLSFLEYIEPFVDEVKRATKWHDVPYEPAALLEHAVSVLGHDLVLHNYERAFSYTDPRAVTKHDNDFTIFNTLSATADVLRDRTMVSKVLTEFAKGKRVLFVCGVAHAVMQEAAYREFLT
jgi:hypothetical protein